MITERQKEIIKILCESFEHVKDEYKEVIEDINLEAKHIVAVSYAESSFGDDPRLCTTRRGGLFQIYDPAGKEAQRYAAYMGKDIKDLQAARYIIKHPQCERGKLSIDYIKNNADKMIKEFLAYLGALLKWQSKYMPKINESKFMKIMLLYHVGGCAKEITNSPSEMWDKQANKCLKRMGLMPIAVPYEYYQRLQRGLWLQENFFRE